MSAGNTSSGHHVDLASDFARFDELPTRLRRVLVAAPYDYDCRLATKALKQAGGNVDKAFAVVVARILDDRDAALRRDWPGDHPMIGRR